MKIIRILFLLLTCYISKAQSTKNVDHQSILWTRYYNLLTLNDKWSLHSEIDNRIFLKPIEENLFVARVQGRYKINTFLETGTGFAYFSISTQDPEVIYDFNVPEYRGQQDLIWKQNLGKVLLGQRFQIEERFIQNANKEGLLTGTSFFWRFRYRIQGEYFCWKNKNQFLKALLSAEIMINAGKKIIKNTFDQNRVYAAFQYGINQNIAIELGYLNSFQQRSSGVDYFNRDIIRFSVFHKMSLNKRKK